MPPRSCPNNNVISRQFTEINSWVGSRRVKENLDDTASLGWWCGLGKRNGIRGDSLPRHALNGPLLPTELHLLISHSTLDVSVNYLLIKLGFS